MSQYRQQLPQLQGSQFITDGGLETTLIFQHDMELPCFAAFDLLKSSAGKKTLRDYFANYCELAQQQQLGFILESPTWRANHDWGQKLGYSQAELADFNNKAIDLLHDLRQQYQTAQTPIVISGCLGPQDDGYNAEHYMSEQEAQQYHRPQINTFQNSQADMVTALTMTYPQEAIGIVRACQQANMPVVISFTVETDGCLPNGQSLGEAIEQVDQATDNGPAYYMINCAHPSHFYDALKADQPWLTRIQGIRANASCKSHAELDEATELDAGNPEQLGLEYQALIAKLKNANVFGGCCGTDERHLQHICHAIRA